MEMRNIDASMMVRERTAERIRALLESYNIPWTRTLDGVFRCVHSGGKFNIFRVFLHPLEDAVQVQVVMPVNVGDCQRLEDICYCGVIANQWLEKERCESFFRLSEDSEWYSFYRTIPLDSGRMKSHMRLRNELPRCCFFAEVFTDNAMKLMYNPSVSVTEALDSIRFEIYGEHIDDEEE